MNLFIISLLLFLNLIGSSLAEIEQCSNLNITISIQETVVESQIQELTWLADQSYHKTVFARTQESLWKSDNEGNTWTDQKSSLLSARGNQLSGLFVIESVYRISSYKAYIVGSNGNIWTTSDRGQTYSFLNVANQISDFKSLARFVPHPANEDWALAYTASARCVNASAPGYCYYSLYLTTNFGVNWKLVDTYVRVFDWGINGKIWYDSFTPKTGHQYWRNPLTYELYLTTTTDLASKVKILIKCGGILMKGNTLFVAQERLDAPGELQLLISKNYGEGAFLVAEIPTDLTQTRYTILDTDDNFFFINVEHQGFVNVGNLYVSDGNDTRFVLSLENNKRDITGHCDFTRIARLNGIYIANYYPDPTDLTTLKTVISFNKGGQWYPLQPPPYDATGKPFFCTIDCSLHLQSIHRYDHTFSSDSDLPYGPLYSTRNAVGLIIATGNVGKSLSSLQGNVGTYFSRDGGVTWAQLVGYSTIYEFADHGALTVMANNLYETTDIFFSLNQRNFTTCHFTNPLARLQVQDIRAEPDVTESTMVLTGLRNENGIYKGIIVFMNFSQIYPRTCQYPQDYEDWTPSDESGRNCYLGMTETYSRRKQDAQCFNGNQYETETKVKICQCSQQDYECDYCFEPYSGKPSICIQICNETVQQPPNCVDYYYVSRGYRLVDGDQCDPYTGLNLLPYQKKCQSSSTTSMGPIPSYNSDDSSLAIALLLIVLLGVVVLSCGSFIVWVMKNPQARATLTNRFPFVDRFRNVGFTRLSNPDTLDDFSSMSQEAQEIQ